MSTELPVRHTNILLCSSYSLRRNSESLLLPESPGSPLELSLPFGCNLYSTSANSERKQQKFLHRRLRGVHIPASRNACRVSKGDPNSLNDLILSSLAEIHVAPSSAPGSYAALLCHCAKAFAPTLGILLHDRIVKDSLERNMILQNYLVQMYGHCGQMQDANSIFASSSERDEYSWNFLIRAYSQHQQSTETIQLFEKMLGEGILPNKFIFTSILLGYSSPEILNQGRCIHVRIISNALDSDTLIGNTLISMYSRCGRLNDARTLFCRFDERDVVSWNAMIAGYTKQGQSHNAIHFSKQMQQEGVLPNVTSFISLLDACANEESISSFGRQFHACFTGEEFGLDVVLGTALLNMYGKYGELERAWRIFSGLPDRNTVSWNGMITAYSLHNQPRHALDLFDQMLQEGLMPDKFIFVTILSAHATKEDLSDGRRMYSRLIGSGHVADPFVQTGILNMFCKCGSMEDGEDVFRHIVRPDEVLWTAMITGYAQHGQARKALDLFERMKSEGPHPSEVTYMSVLSACSRTGLVEEGLQHLLSMETEYGIKPSVQHINCVSDMLAKAGRLDELEELIFSVVDEATIVTWTTLLDACKKQLDVDRGKRVAKHVLKEHPDYTSPYVILSHIYTVNQTSDHKDPKAKYSHSVCNFVDEHQSAEENVGCEHTMI